VEGTDGCLRKGALNINDVFTKKYQGMLAKRKPCLNLNSIAKRKPCLSFPNIF